MGATVFWLAVSGGVAVIAVVSVVAVAFIAGGVGSRDGNKPVQTKGQEKGRGVPDPGVGASGGFAVKAMKVTGKARPAHQTPSKPGSTDDFLDAMEILGLPAGAKFEPSKSMPFAWFPIQGRGVDAKTWAAVFGTPERLPDGLDLLNQGRLKLKYQRWRHRLTDGPVTMHGNIVGDGYLPSRACLY